MRIPSTDAPGSASTTTTVLAAQDPPVVLVLDGFHLLTEPGVLERLDYVLRNAKSGRTEGWAAGLRPAALSLQGRPDPEQFVKELQAGDSAITSYLVEEVLNAQPAPVRDMLLRTSILDASQRGGSSRAATRVDLTVLVFHPSRVGRGRVPVDGLSATQSA
jgi:ATP/maltotriose-dependent transcriptional regulator MalT